MGYEHNKAWRKRHPEKRYAGQKRYHGRNRKDLKNTRNSRQEWTGAEMSAIISPNRPSDRILSRKLGRSIKAIQIKRGRVLSED